MLEKKRCDVCGARIRLSANKSPKNVILCKNCASRLSVWFTGEKGSSLTEIREQLAFREANRREVLAFQTTRSYGTYTKLYVDEPAGKFLICGSSNFLEVNPDVLSFDQVTGCEIEIPETRHEIRRRVSPGKDFFVDWQSTRIYVGCRSNVKLAKAGNCQSFRKRKGPGVPGLFVRKEKNKNV